MYFSLGQIRKLVGGYSLTSTFMTNHFSIDLRCARRKAGLTQEDCGHLLGGSAGIICQLEKGKRLPTLKEVCSLSLIFGRSFETLFANVMSECRTELSDRLSSETWRITP